MGLYTLANFRDEIEVSTGNMGLDSTRLTRYVNFAYLEIIGSVEFDSLVERSAFATVVGQAAYTIPGGAEVKAVLDEANLEDGLLGYRGLIDFYRLNRSASGIPTVWTREGDSILLAPTPSVVGSLSMLLRNDPDPLAADADVTELPATWDPGVSLLATHYAKLSIGLEDATTYYNRAVQYLASRVADEEKRVRNSGLGLAIRNAMQGAA